IRPPATFTACDSENLSVNAEAADALAIWQAGLAAVDSERLVREAIVVRDGVLHIGAESIDLAGVRRIEVVGAGKAGAGMAAGVEAALGADLLREKQVSGWLNVPADCVRSLSAIHLHPARPAGVNEPTEGGAAGTEEILRRVAALEENDLCLCLISGGGSALLPAPAAGLSIADKQRVIRFLSGAGATIQELNGVRKRLSRVKGGGLARACRAGRLIVLVISDVTGDPLDIIASGPTVVDSGDAREALAILDRFGARQAGVPESVFAVLEQRVAEPPSPPTCRISHQVIGSNRTAVEAAVAEAQRLGYRTQGEPAVDPEGDADGVGRKLIRRMWENSVQSYQCLVTGGEPVVSLPPAESRGRGGRNQQLVLAALEEAIAHRASRDPSAPEPTERRFALLSGGTDGEDGPTDAAGAWIDAQLVAQVAEQASTVRDALARCDAYSYFDRLGALVRTGPTHTNVMDLRVLCIGPQRPKL
ncbi:MAG TPA: DUF4147 domain-containing protein, partial [Pirellulales bacterium]